MQHNIRETADALSALLSRTLDRFQQLQKLPESRLQQHPVGGGWNALECLEHLNRYAAFYVPEMQKALARAPENPKATYRSGWLGAWFATSMRAENAKPGKMQSPASKNPSGASLNAVQVLDTFEQHLVAIPQILMQARTADWTHTRIPTSLSPLLRINLGDTLRFYIHHIDRHMQQAMRAAG